MGLVVQLVVLVVGIPGVISLNVQELQIDILHNMFSISRFQSAFPINYR